MKLFVGISRCRKDKEAKNDKNTLAVSINNLFDNTSI
jgi:hypothetical protein